MPRAFLIKKKHSTTKRKNIVADEDFSVHEPRDYSKKDSVASDSGNESCSPANSPSPQPYTYYQRHHPLFHPDDIPQPPTPPAATALIAHTSLDIYGRPTVLEPLNMNASLSNLSGWMKPYFPSYLQFGGGCSPFHSQHGLPYGFTSAEPFLAKRSISPLTPTEEPSATDGSKCLDLTSNGLSRKPTSISKILTEEESNKKHSETTHWTELPQDVKMHDVELFQKKQCSSGRRRGTDGPRYNCPDCNKSYSTYSGLSKHQQFHCSTNNKRSFSCKYCEKVYVSLGALKMHIRTHTLPCKCKLCGKAFSRPWLLQGHIRTHTGEKPFTCPHCNRAFADRSNLRAHLQTHSDVKKYSCKTCAKTFSRMSLLLKHEDGGCGQCGTASFPAISMQERLGP